MQRIKAELIIFDLDGTLIDSRKDIANSVNHTLKAIGLEPLNENIITGYVGNGVRSLMEKILFPANSYLFDKGMSIFLDYYAEHLLDNTNFFSGVIETLNYFADKKMAVVTNKPENLSIKTLRGLGVYDYFKAVLGGDSLEKKKPSPEPVLKVLSDLNIKKEAAIIVGDGLQDIAAGKGAGIRTCAVTYGFTKTEELAKAEPTLIINSLHELKEMLE
jgi:phosphoglycolate phosphatase